MATRIITDGSTDRVREAPRVVLPDNPRLFEERAARFAQLADGHPMGAYLGLMARICRGQQAALARRAAARLPDAALEQSRNYGMPPLSSQGHARAPLWRAGPCARSSCPGVRSCALSSTAARCACPTAATWSNPATQ